MSMNYPCLRTCFTALVAALLCAACTSPDGTNSPATVEFSLSAALGDAARSDAVLAKSLTQASSVLVTITDAADVEVYTAHQVELIAFGDSYLSQPLSLLPGSYSVTQFSVLDSADVALYATPVEGSSTAHLVTDPLPMQFATTADDVTTLAPQTISTNGLTPEDFGYVSFAPEVVEIIDFLVAAFAFDHSLEELALTDASILVTNDVGDVLYAGNLASATNHIKVPANHAQYQITVDKPGYDSESRSFTDPELRQYFLSSAEGSLEIVLNETAYAASCQGILDAGDSTGDGVYTIDPDGFGGQAAFAAYCDMTRQGGGWTLIHKSDLSSAGDRTDAGFNTGALLSPNIDAVAILPRATLNSIGTVFWLEAPSVGELFWTGPEYVTTDTGSSGAFDTFTSTSDPDNMTLGNHGVGPEHGMLIWTDFGADPTIEHIALQRWIGGGTKIGFWFNGGVWSPGSYNAGRAWVR